MPFRQVNGRQLFYTRQGHSLAGRPVLVLVHGAAANRLVWPAALRRLEEYEVITLDLPAHGRSEGPPVKTIAALAHSVAELLAGLESRPWVILGHSMGGAIAQQVALRHDQNLAGLILLATAARLPVSETLTKLLHEDIDQARELLAQLMWPRGTPADVLRETQAQLGQEDPVVTRTDFAACQAFDAWAGVGSISVPVCVIAGNQDRLVRKEQSKALADAIPKARYVVLDGAGHQLMLQQPEQVAAEVKTFLAALSAGGDRRKG